MPALKAADLLETRAGELSAERLHDAVLLATGSKAQAEAAMCARISANLKDETRDPMA